MATNDVTKSSTLLRHFQTLDMVMIIVYAIWMGIEADWNDALLITEPWHSQNDPPVELELQMMGPGCFAVAIWLGWWLWGPAGCLDVYAIKQKINCDRH